MKILEVGKVLNIYYRKKTPSAQVVYKLVILSSLVDPRGLWRTKPAIDPLLTELRAQSPLQHEKVDPPSLALSRVIAPCSPYKPANMAAAIGKTGEREIPLPYPNPKSLHLMGVKRVSVASQQRNRLERCCYETFRRILRLNG